MPTIEIISLNAKSTFVKHENYEFAILEETTLASHRALFNQYISDKKGIILHLGNPEFKHETDGAFFASELINWDFEPRDIEIPNFDFGETGANQSARFQFEAKYRPSLEALLNKSIQAAPDSIVLFYTDYQFGDGAASYKTTSLKQFWAGHDQKGLRWNRLYTITVPG